MRDNIKISVIIPTFNRSSYLHKCLEGLFQQDYPAENYEVIVVDDGSVDDTQRLLSEYKGRCLNLRTISYTENRGVSYARNRGLDAAKGEIIALLDSDCIPSLNWLQKIEELFHDPKVMCVQGTQKDGGKWGSYNLAQGSELIESLKRIGRLDTKNLILRRDSILKYKFDESLVASEDIDIALRLSKGGVPVMYADRISVTHVVDTFSEVVNRAKRWGRGQAQVYLKYCGWGNHTNRKLGRSFAFNCLFYFAAFWFQLIRYRDLRGAFARMVLRIIMSIYFKKELESAQGLSAKG